MDDNVKPQITLEALVDAREALARFDGRMEVNWLTKLLDEEVVVLASVSADAEEFVRRLDRIKTIEELMFFAVDYLDRARPRGG